MNFQTLLHLYGELQKLLSARNFRFRVIGGHASRAMQLSEFTKDLDIGIIPQSEQELLRILEEYIQGNPEVLHFNYRAGLGAPLDNRWTSQGWTSHYEIITQDVKARLDVFPRLPRVAPELIDNPKVSEEHIFAETKKTQRARDWDMLQGLALRMIENQDALGFLHIFEAESAKEAAARGILPKEEILHVRPSLHLLAGDEKKLEAAFLVEKIFWQKWDNLRLRAYLSAGKNYFKSLGEVREKLALTPLVEQHKTLVQYAEQHLPLSPFLLSPVADIYEEILLELREMFPEKLLSILPERKTILHADGIYYPFIRASYD